MTLMPPTEVELPAIANGDLTGDDEDFTALDVRSMDLFISLRVFGVSRWYQWYANIGQGFTNGANGYTICTNYNFNGTIGSPNGTIGANGKPMVPLVSQWYHLLPMVPLVKFPLVPLGEPRTEPLIHLFQGVRIVFLEKFKPEYICGIQYISYGH